MSRVTVSVNVTVEQENHSTTRPRCPEVDDQLSTWAKRKKTARTMAAAMKRIGHEGRAARMWGCGETMETMECPKGDHRHVVRSTYCRDRMCPICAAGRARKMAREMTCEVGELIKRDPETHWILLTLTTPNVTDDKLHDEVRRVVGGWREMARRTTITGAAKGWVRRLELTYNAKEKTHHVHVHVMMAVDEDYYYNEKKYRTQAEFVEAWAKAIGHDLGNGPLIVDVRAADAAVEEVAKYCAKPWEIADGGNDPAIVAVVDAMKGVRTAAWGGLWRKVRYELGHVDDDKMADEDSDVMLCPVCKTPLQAAIYRWAGADYVADPGRELHYVGPDGTLYYKGPWYDHGVDLKKKIVVQ